MNYTDIDQVTESEIKVLLEQEVIENSHLEYKENISFGNDKEKKELLADVCSFCNIGGGTIIYGVEEKREDGKTTGIPKQVLGINDNIDELIRKIDESVRHSIEPIVIGLKMKHLEVFNKKLLIIYIPRSINPPHMVTFKGSSKFWRRANASKYQMGVEEIRSSVLESGEIRKKIKDFRNQRVGEILNDDTPVLLENNPKIVMHILPVESFRDNNNFDISSLNQSRRLKYMPFTHHGCNSRINFDGFFTYWASSYEDGVKSLSYTQVYRNGIIETVDAESLSEWDGKKMIPSVAYEDEVIKTSTSLLKNLVEDGMSGPTIIYLSLLGVKGYEMAVGRMAFPRFQKTLIEKEDLLLPEIYIESIESYEPLKMLKPSFDMIWNACGYEKSFNFDENGEWINR